MTQFRYNTFNNVHKGMRALLYNTAMCIQHTDFGTDEANTTIEKVLEVVELFNSHAHHEDTHVLPMIDSHNPQLVEEFESEHVVDHRLSQSLADHCQAWLNAATEGERIMCGQALFYAFNEFVAFNLYHMNKEENVLLLNLWQHYTDGELLASEKVLIASVPPDIRMKVTGWMMRGISDNEVVQWLKGAKLGAPAEVFNALAAAAQQNIAPNRWQKIAEALALQPVAA